MSWSADDVMLSRKRLNVVDDPFPYFTIDEYLPPDLYEQLRRDWPSDEAVMHQLAEGKFDRSLDDRTLSALPESFRWLIGVYKSQAFVDDYFAVLRRVFRRACAPLPIRGFKLQDAEAPAGLFKREIEFSGQFSRLEEGAFLSPHTDKFTKFLSLLIYFPPDDWREEYGGETVLFEAVNPRHRRNWSNRHLPFEMVREAARSRYKPNSAFGFIKAPNSWHGVLPVTAPPGVVRHSLNVNYQTSARARKTLLHRALAACHHRTEAPRFRDAPDMKEENRRMRDARIIDLAESGVSVEDMAARFSISEEAVKRVLEKRAR